MKNRIIKNTVNKFIQLLIISLFVGFSYSCDSIINNINELPEEQDDEASNPRDPFSDAFILPNIEFINGDFSFSSPFTINQRDLTLEWGIFDQGGTSIDFDYTFQYRYAHSSESIATQPFIDLNTERSFTLSNLKETFDSEAYNFEILASYSSESVSKDTSFTGQFYVDAFQNRGFLFNPRVINSNNDGSYSVKVFLDEIQESDDLTAFSLVLNYTGSYFDVSEEDITIYNSTDSFLYREGGEVISFTEVTSNTITIEVGIAGSNLTPFSGGGVICEILLTPTNIFPGSSSISISNASILKTSDGSDISILEYDAAEISP